MRIKLGVLVGCMLVVQSSRAEDGKTAAVALQAVAMTAVGAPVTQPPRAVRYLPAGVVEKPRSARRPKRDAAPEVTIDGSRGGVGGGAPRFSDTCPATDVGVLTSGSTIVGSTIGSSDTFVAGCQSQPGARDEIFEFAVDVPGFWTLDSCTVPACWDTTLEIREETGGGCPGDFVACDDDGCNVCYYDSAVSAFLVPTSTYYLIVDGWSTFAYGDFTITANQAPCDCANDADCDDGIFCNGSETCDVPTCQCLAGTAVSCTTYEGYAAPCDQELDACAEPDPCFTWIAGAGTEFFLPGASYCPDLANWVFDDVQGSHHTTGVLDFYTTPIRARSTPEGASPLGTEFPVDQALFTVESGTCNPLVEIAGSQCAGIATVDASDSPPHDLPCTGTMPLLPNNSGDFTVCEIDFFLAYRTAENGAGMLVGGDRPELGGPGGADDFGVSVLWLEDCPPTGLYEVASFGDDDNTRSDFATAVVCQKPEVQCCTPEGSCSVGTEDDCTSVGGAVVCTGTIIEGHCACEGDTDGNGVDDGCEICGDEDCGGSESECTCPEDCPVRCGDGCCSSAPRGEDCPQDCDCDVGTGSDCFETQCGTSIIDLRNIPIPGETFGDNSKAFDRVLWLFSSTARDFGLRWTRSELADACSATPSPLLVEEIYLTSCNPIVVERDDGSGNFDFWDVEVTLSPVPAPSGEISIQRTHANGGTFTADFWVRPSFKFQPTVQSDPPVSVEYPSGGEVLPPFRLRTVGAASFVDTPDPVLTIDACSVDFVPGVRENTSTGDQCCERFQLSGPDIHLELYPAKCSAFCQTGACCLPDEFDRANRCDDTLDEQGCEGAGGIWQSSWADCDDEDGDGLQDGYETRAARGLLDSCHHGTDPLNPDTDGDTCSDFTEVVQSFAVRSDPLSGCDSICGPTPIVNDCNDNDREDLCDIACGVGNDCNGLPGSDDSNDNGIPDECDPQACCFVSQGFSVCQNLNPFVCETLENGVSQGMDTACPTGNIFAAGHGSGPFTHLTDPAEQCPAGGGRGTDCIEGDPIDPWKTAQDAVLCHQFGGFVESPPIPADFFGPGSDPFTGQVCLEGQPLGQTEWGTFAEADTLVRRTGGPAGTGDPFDRCDLPPSFPSDPVIVDVEVVALNLTSTSPIVVTFNGGQNPEQWDVAVDLSEVTPAPGTITAIRTHCNGGTYSSELHVQPRFTFSEVGGSGEEVLDTGLEGIPFVALVQDDDPPWTSDVSEDLPSPTMICTDFHPGIEDPAPITACDCTTNLVRDKCEIEQGSSQDCNGDGIPDECQLTGNDCNGNGIPDECETDCNANGVPDDCDIDPSDPDGNGLVSPDCDGGNGNGVPDECEFDCNDNGVADSCDIARGTSDDVDANAVPDECLGELTGRCCLAGGDCIRVTEDVCNASDGAFGGIGSLCGDDTDGDGATDECDNCPIVVNASQEDCDGDGEGDACETDSAAVDDDDDGHCNGFDNCPAVSNPGQDDCDDDGEGDACEADAADQDDDHDGVCAGADNCPTVLNRGQEDCDGDGEGDACEADAANRDDDNDGICNVADNCPDAPNSGQEDCDGDGEGDACEADAANRDDDHDGICNVADNCPDVSNPGQEDCDGDGVGDACGGECPALPPLPADPPNDRLKNRYISFKPNNLVGQTVKLEVTLTDSLPHPGLVGSSWWVRAPQAPGNPLLPPGECVALLGPQGTAADIDWETSGCTVLHVTGCPIEPTSGYDVRAVAGAATSGPLAVPTSLQPAGGKFWGDTVNDFNGVEWTAANGFTNINDVVAAIKTWQGGAVVAPMPGIPVAHLSVADVEPGDINLVVNFNDVFAVVLAFTADPYPFGPADADGNCPPP